MEGRPALGHPDTAANSFRSIRIGLAKWSRGDLACLLYINPMDLDVKDIPVHKLADQVGGILESKPFAQILQVREMAVEHITSFIPGRTSATTNLLNT
ncbi:MAG TPA: hypothetical protein DCZ95_10475 [Verrucomicrobia bacterium]|nr:MAG: hypothetical protein A2X46_18665 [Lentisphaerae bacterium GWF2_57_35]HBA84507.1 hypothetical protein [Verrucomicrobiota bacterium]